MRGRVAAVIVLIVLLVGIVVPAQANIAGSTLGAVSLGPVAYSVPFDITFTANFTSTGGLEKGEYMDYIDVTVPNQWTINAVYNTPHAVPANYTGCLGTTEGTLGQTIFWASTCTDVGAALSVLSRISAPAAMVRVATSPYGGFHPDGSGWSDTTASTVTLSGVRAVPSAISTVATTRCVRYFRRNETSRVPMSRPSAVTCTRTVT